MVLVHPGVEDGDGVAAAIRAARPRLIGLNQRHALRQQRRVKDVLGHASHVLWRRDELAEGGAADVEREERHRFETMDDLVCRAL